MMTRRMIRFIATFVLVSHASAFAQRAPANKPLKLLPPYGELPPTFWEQHGTTIIIVSLAVVLIAALVAWWLLRPKPPVFISPEVQARRALENYLNRQENGAVLSQVSQILRRYVIAAFDLPPGEPTTTEFCRMLSGQNAIGVELSNAVSEFLRQCDEHKFSPQPPAEPPGAVARALELVSLGEARRAQLRQSALAQSRHPSPATA